MEKEPKMYEMLYFLSPLITEDNLGAETDVLRSLIESQQGVIIYEDRSKLQNLSYSIDKFEKAYLGMIKFIIKPDMLFEVEDALRKNNKIIRFLITGAKKEEKKSIRPKRAFIKHEPQAEKSQIKVEEVDKKIEELAGA